MDMWLLLLISLFSAPDLSFSLLQNDLDYMALTLKILARVVSNLEYPKKHRERLTLINTGNKPFAETGWVLYFDSFRSIEPDHLPLPGTVYLEEQHVNVTLIQGQLTAITPVTGFGELQPNETRHLHFFNELWSVSRYEFMPNWYLGSVDDTLEPRIIESTRNYDFVEPFDTSKQWKRTRDDIYNPFTLEERFERNNIGNTVAAAKLIIPTPERIVVNETERIHLDQITCKIIAEVELQNEVDILREATGCEHTQTEQKISNAIYLTVATKGRQSAIGGHNEEYSIRMEPSRNSVHIHGFGYPGVFYGIQTFLSILESYKNGTMPVISIDDKPRFPYRGMHLDVARSFHGVAEVKRLVKAMAMYKLNKLHLHLSDDEGWRLEINGLKELTEVGARRCHDQETRCLLPQYGSGPFRNTSASGFYNISDYQAILRFAKRHHVEVVPEFDFPGHSHAAVRAMETRYQHYKSTGNESAANEFRLFDPEDKSKYLSIQEFNDNAINPCIESTYAFIDHVVKEVQELHRTIQPLRMFHFGGDEVAKGAWIGSPACSKLRDTNPELIGPKDWKRYFVHRVSNITARYNLSLGGWEDGFMAEDNDPYPRQSFNNKDDVAYSWSNVWEWGTSLRAYRLANRGYKVVMSQATNLYFDHPAEPDPEERGLNWATRFTDTRKVFGFMPDSLYENIDTLLSGKPTYKAEICGNNMEKCDALARPENVLGIQGQIWTEIVRTTENLHFMIFPRLLALAERAWHRAEWEGSVDLGMRKTLLDRDWAEFAVTLGHKELQRLDDRGIHYRVPLPGARVADGNIETCTSFPGLAVQYSVDSGTTWKTVPKHFNQPNGSVHLRTLSADGKRHSRVVILQMPPSSDGNIINSKTIIWLCLYAIYLFTWS